MRSPRARERDSAARAARAGVATLVFAITVGGGAAQAGPGLPDLDALEPGGDALGRVVPTEPGQRHDCPPTAPKGHHCHDDPQGDFRPNGDRVKEGAARSDRSLRRVDPRAAPQAGADRRRQGHVAGSDTDGHSTLEQTIVGGDPEEGFQFLGLGPGEPRIVREDLADAQPGREARRISLAYLGHLTDFQVSDEESPARVEFVDVFGGPVSAAQRPQEAMVAHGADQAIRQMNNFTAASPHSSLGAADSALSAKAADGTRAAAALGKVEMEAALMTGDLADNQQRNETEWVVRLLEGGPLDPNSGIDDFSVCPGGVGPSDPQLADPRNYAGVQDKDDYPLGFTGNLNQFYDPDAPGGVWSDWPIYTGLMDKAQDPFQVAGLKMPNGDPVRSYVVFGNHDALAQGNQKAIAPFEAVGIGCVKPLLSVANLPDFGLTPNPPDVSSLGAEELMIVPPDPARQYVDKAQFKEINDTGFQADAHGFSLVDPDEEAASDGAAGYYAFDLKPGIRMIGLDTLCEAGVTGPSAAGNIDDPQWQWLIGELEAAQAAGKLVIPFGHHPISSLICDIPDETPPACSTNDSHGHDMNPGCDRDPRSSSPIHDGTELAELFRQYPNVIAYIAGHTHQQTLSSFSAEPSSGQGARHSHGPGEEHSHRHRTPASHGGEGNPGDFWGIETASLVDWPPQTRLVEVMDNCDGTLSIFATVLDSSAPATAPEGDDPQQVPARDPTSHVDDFTPAELASVSRTLAYNDFQGGPGGGGQGEPEDRNVELLLEDPRPEPSAACLASDGDGPKPGPGPDEDEEPEEPEETTGGSLPFTGLGLLGLVALGGGLLASGLAARLLRR